MVHWSQLLVIISTQNYHVLRRIDILLVLGVCSFVQLFLCSFPIDFLAKSFVAVACGEKCSCRLRIGMTMDDRYAFKKVLIWKVVYKNGDAIDL